MENRQRIINSKEVFFELKTIIQEHDVKKATIIYDCGHSESILLRYLQEMGVESQDCEIAGMSYDRSHIADIIKAIDLDNVQLITALGSGAVINAVKYLKLKTGINTPVIYSPSYIEAGDEANGRILLFDKDGPEVLSDEGSLPEYVFYDPEFINTRSERDTNTCLARGICQAVNVLWTNDPESTAAVSAAKGLSIIIDSITKIQRGDRQYFGEALEGARLVGEAVKIAGDTVLDKTAAKLAALCGYSLGQAMMKLAAPISLSVEDFLLSRGIHRVTAKDDKGNEKKLKNDKEHSIYKRLTNVARQVAPAAFDINGSSFQLAFFEFVFGLHDKLPEDDAVMDIAKSFDLSLFEEWPVEMNKDAIKTLMLRAFHKDSIKNYNKRYELSVLEKVRVKRDTKLINDMKEKYGENMNDDRIIDDPYLEEQMERQALVKGLQTDVLETLLLSKALLEKYGLRYYLSEGTLLGAVRHKGFIPWDDDVDIMMPREDYNKLVDLDRKGLIPPELNLDALENNPKHWVLGAKLQLTRESKFIQTRVTNLSKFNGPYIDIFPLDYWNSPYSKKQYKAQRKVKMCRRLLFMKTGYSKEINGRWHRVIMRGLVHIIPNTAIEKYAIKNMTKFNNGNRKFMVHLASYYKYYKEVFPASCYGEPLYKEFEGHEFPVPREYDFILRSIYGNHYDSLPPASLATLRNHTFEAREKMDD